MPLSRVSILITIVNICICICIQNNSVTIFGVDQSNIDGNGCGINYDTNTIYIIEGKLNGNYGTWNGLNTTDWSNITNYNNIVSPTFQVTPINSDILESIPGFNIGQWYCGDTPCTTQVNQTPYIYIVGANNGFNYDIDDTVSMLIYDMNGNNYIESSKYKYAIPGNAKTGVEYII